MTSAQLCFDAYSFDESLATTIAPNFDPHLFAASKGDTVYVRSSPEEQEMVGPLIVNLLAQIHRARYELWMFDKQEGFTERFPMFWLLDELMSLAKDPAVPSGRFTERRYGPADLRDMSGTGRRVGPQPTT